MLQIADWRWLSADLERILPRDGLLMLGTCRAQQQGMVTTQSRAQALQIRLISHASAILNLSSILPKTSQANHISRQLVRSGTAAAANYGEARGAESRSDFVHKLRIVLKELNETAVWLQLIVENRMLPLEKMKRIVAENEELCRIIAASIKTTGGFDRSRIPKRLPSQNLQELSGVMWPTATSQP